MRLTPPPPRFAWSPFPVSLRETGEEKNCEGEIAREVSAVGHAQTVSNLVHRHTQLICRQFAVWSSGQRPDTMKDGLGWRLCENGEAA